MANVVVTARLPGRLDAILAGHQVTAPAAGETVLSPEELRVALATADAILPLLSVRIDEALLAAAPRLRLVANYAVGYDNVDVPAATRRGVLITNTPGVLTEATADLTLALLLAAARRLREGLALATSGAWHGWEPDQLTGFDLDGATLGLVGLGRIGQAVARRARGFGLRLLYAAPRRAEVALEASLGLRHVPLDELLASADIVSLHCPLRPETRHLLGARELDRMKPTALLINTARGPILDEAALVDALERGHLGGVGLDVFEAEPKIPPRLAAIPRAILLPHIGSATHHARARMAETAAQSIVDFFAGRRPAHPVNPEVLG
jgi:glyoxylate reductase